MASSEAGCIIPARAPGERWRAPYASQPGRSRGRLHAEEASPTRSEFQRDRDRIIHSAAFRRLKHKTQVFVYHEGDHFRTRLTHSLEVSQIARAIARALGGDEDLAEALALSHDLGHTPFGHTGEDTLDELLAAHGGFDHNAQALRVVTALERRYAAFDGLNLTWETLEGLVKHNGPLLDAQGRPMPRYTGRGVPAEVLAYNAGHDLALATQPGVEAQAAALADDIAYNAHDLDDGLRAGLFALTELGTVGFIADLLAEVDRRYPQLETSRRIHELTRRVITRFVEDAIAESGRRLSAIDPADADAVRAAPVPVVALSDAMAAADRAIKAFLLPAMYRHPRVAAVRGRADAILRDLFSRFVAEPAAMPPEWRPEPPSQAALARAAGDYIAGMTDRYALLEHRRLFAATPDLHLD